MKHKDILAVDNTASQVAIKFIKSSRASVTEVKEQVKPWENQSKRKIFRGRF